MAIPIPVPPLARQEQFDTLLSKADTLRTLQADPAVELNALIPAVLARAFSGKL